jgi:hypothetical protein
MRFRPRLDTTQREIVEALRKAGYSVRSLAGVGNGCPDILVGCQRGNVLLEAKGEHARTHKKGILSDQEKLFFTAWLGPVALVFSAEDALSVVANYAQSGSVPARIEAL